MSIAPSEPPKSIPPSPAAGSVSTETPGMAPEDMKGAAGVANRPPGAEPPVGEDQAEAGHRIKLKPRELPLATIPVPESGDRMPAAPSVTRPLSPLPNSPPAPVEELPPLLSSYVKKRPLRRKVDPVALVISIVGLLLFFGVAYHLYSKHAGGPAGLPPGLSPALESIPAANQKAAPGPSASARVLPAPVPAGPPSAPPPTLSGRSARFHLFVDKLKIGGIRFGPPPRLFIEGLTYKPGDVVDQRLGIIFVGLDVTRKEIVFKDGTGAMVRRRY